jgi:hypothetical protein
LGEDSHFFTLIIQGFFSNGGVPRTRQRLPLRYPSAPAWQRLPGRPSSGQQDG